MAAIVKEKISYYRGTLQMDVDESKIYKDVEKEAKNSLNTIMANYNHKALTWFAKFMKALTQSIYSKIVVNEDALKRVRATIEQRKGPVIFAPTHRSYVDFLLVSSIVFYYNIQVPYICAGEDLMQMPGISNLLRASGAFFMRRTFRGDPLYKAIFTEYVTQLAMDKAVMEFFAEGTRSRTNKMLAPKFGIVSILTNTFFDKKCEEITFIPTTINYTRTLEDSSFPGELTG